MKASDVFGIIVAIIVPVATFVMGILVGNKSAYSSYNSEMNSVGIEKIVHHTTVVDGICVTNWNEIIWFKK